MESDHPVHTSQTDRGVTCRRIPPAGLGDLVRVTDTLDLDQRDARIVAELLSLIPSVTKAGSGDEVTVSTMRAAQPPAPQKTGPVATSRGGEGLRVSETAVGATARPLAVVAAVEQARATRAPVSGRALAQLLPRGGPAPPSQGLFSPRTARALLRSVSSWRSPEGPLDVEAAVTQLATDRILTDMPMQWIETTSGSVQLLLDAGAAMEPYRRDIERLPEELMRVVGPDGVELRWFEDCPYMSGVLAPNDEEPTHYRPPLSGARLLAVTTFGTRGALAPSADVVRGWLALAADCRRNQIPMVALSPLSARRVPAALKRRIATVAWDRKTDVRDVAEAVRAARLR